MDKIENSLTQLIDLFKEKSQKKWTQMRKKLSHQLSLWVHSKLQIIYPVPTDSLTSGDTNKISRHIDGIINSDILNSDIIDTTAPKDEHKSIEAKNLSPDASTDANYDEDNDREAYHEFENNVSSSSSLLQA